MDKLLSNQNKEGYELLDSGDGMKFERFGSFTLVRPDPEAIWRPHLSQNIWKSADATFIRKGTTGTWKTKSSLPKEWLIFFEGLFFEIRPTSFKHVGLFPEQGDNWSFIEKKIKKQKEKIHVLNLFAYTGGATVVCAKVGAEVTHVDASKPVVEWARKNTKLNNIGNAPIRWIVDDVLMFVKREVKRGKKYDAIIMDPPAFGHGPHDELWKIEKDLSVLVEECFKLLSDKPLFFIISGYASGYSAIAFANLLLPLITKYNGTISHKELTIKEVSSNRLLPAGVVARWEKE